MLSKSSSDASNKRDVYPKQMTPKRCVSKWSATVFNEMCCPRGDDRDLLRCVSNDTQLMLSRDVLSKTCSSLVKTEMCVQDENDDDAMILIIEMCCPSVNDFFDLHNRKTEMCCPNTR